jgi:hypothetical protein
MPQAAGVLWAAGSAIAVACERPQHRQQGGAVWDGLKELGVGRFHGGDGLVG